MPLLGGNHLQRLLHAKRNSTAADNLADFVCVSLSDQPISLANAFEEPVKSKNGFIKPSIQQFAAYKKGFTTNMNGPEKIR